MTRIRHRCNLCGLEDGACICAHLPPAKPERRDIILRAMLAYMQHNPPPADAKTARVRAMSTKMSQSRYESMAAYIDQQLSSDSSGIRESKS